MTHFTVFIIGFISAYLFDLMPVAKNTRILFELQRDSISAIRKQSLTDELKQKLLLANSGKSLLVTLKLLVLVGISVLPFTFIVLIGPILFQINFSEILISFIGILLCCLAFIAYFLVKKLYERFRL